MRFTITSSLSGLFLATALLAAGASPVRAQSAEVPAPAAAAPPAQAKEQAPAGQGTPSAAAPGQAAVPPVPGAALAPTTADAPAAPAAAPAPTEAAPTPAPAAAAAPGGPTAAPGAPTAPTAPTAAPPVPTEPTAAPPPGGSFPTLRTGSSDGTPPGEHGAPDIATSPLPPFEGGEHGTAHAGGGHEGPLIENWWSWDYGPGKAYHHPPFGFALINFAVFLLILSRLAGKSFRDFLRTRHTDVRRALDRAREAQEHAERHLRQIEERSRNLEAEIAELLATFRRQAEAERQGIIARAEAEAAGLLRDAESQARGAIESARRQLEQKTALLAVDLAEKLLRSQLRDDDYRRLNEQYIAQLEKLPHPATTGGAVAAAGKESP